MKKVRVAVTGGAGHICYNLLFRIASGEVFGKETLVDLTLLELPMLVDVLKGVEMELLDCAFKNLSSITLTVSEEEAFDGVDFAILVGAKPRSKGMERKDLLQANGKIFATQGKALNQSKNARVLVLGNPCNTNALILKHAAKELDPKNIFAMTRLDQNRATAMIAKKAGVPVSKVSGVSIFGNHSTTMVPHYSSATIDGRKAVEVIDDLSWFQTELFSCVQNRGAEIIAARGLSSAASAADAAVDSIHDILRPAEVYSAAVYSNNNPYGIEQDLFFSFPLEDGKIVSGLSMDSFLEQKIKETEKELIREREMVREFLGG